MQAPETPPFATWAQFGTFLVVLAIAVFTLWREMRAKKNGRNGAKDIEGLLHVLGDLRVQAADLAANVKGQLEQITQRLTDQRRAIDSNRDVEADKRHDLRNEFLAITLSLQERATEIEKTLAALGSVVEMLHNTVERRKEGH
jgi:hypothetical protein